MGADPTARGPERAGDTWMGHRARSESAGPAGLPEATAGRDAESWQTLYPEAQRRTLAHLRGGNRVRNPDLA